MFQGATSFASAAVSGWNVAKVQTMKAMFTAFAAIAIIAVGAWFGLKEYGGFGSGNRQAGTAVRLE